MDLTTCLEHYAEEKAPRNEVKRVSHIIFAYIFLSAGLTFNLYTFFYWINFMTSPEHKAGRLFPMEVVYMANVALIYCVISGTLMYHYRKKHRAFLKQINATVDISVLDQYSTEELVNKLKKMKHKESLWKQKLDAGLIAGILSVEIATLDANNVYNFLIGFVIIPLIGFVIFGLFVDRYDEGLFSNTQIICMMFLLRKTIDERKSNQSNEIRNKERTLNRYWNI